MAQEAEPNTIAEDSGLESLRKALRVSFNLLVLFMVGTILFFLWKCVFIVEAPDVGLILRFGKIVTKDRKAVLSDGAYLTFPYPIDRQIRLSTASQSVKSSSLWHDPAGEKKGREGVWGCEVGVGVV